MLHANMLPRLYHFHAVNEQLHARMISMYATYVKHIGLSCITLICHIY